MPESKKPWGTGIPKRDRSTVFLSGSPLRIVLGYALFGAIWITFSDMLMVKLVPEQFLETASISKGWLFIAVTAMQLYHFIGRRLANMAQMTAQARESEAIFRSLFEHVEELVKERTENLEQKTIELERSQTAMQYLLEDVKEVNKQLEQANYKLKEVDQLKSMFIASMSHELRTPLNSVIGFSSILLNEWIGTLNDEQKKSMTSILRSGKHLLALINDVIDVSKIEAGKIEVGIDDFDLSELLGELEQTFAKEARDHGISLDVQELHLPMHTDRRRLQQCLFNLISNAIKFTEHGGVAVVVRHDEMHGEVTFVVTDTGIGIGEEDQAKLFKAFSRIQSHLSAKVPGTGLGLYLTNKIVLEILRGTISVMSEPGSGSAFSISIPSRLEEEQKVSLAPVAIGVKP